MPPILPIDAVLHEIRATIVAGAVVVTAPPGSGKTTRVPPALLDCVDGEIVVLQPRRLAARVAARFVAEERGEKVGETVGYQVRFEDVTSARTRLRFVTEGVLTRRLVADPGLRGVGAVVLDEFHERHLHGDLALALVRRLAHVRIVVMSATLDAEGVAGWLGAPVVRAEGRRFEVAIEHLERPPEGAFDDGRVVAREVAAAVRRLIQEGWLAGDVLVFLPGAAEIRRAAEACADIARRVGAEVVTLHGDMPAAEQDRVVRPAARPRIILSTNVAETSVTLPNVVAVIDSGLARVASHSPWSGLPLLKVARVSQASAAQRAGRAGRTRPGRCLRLYTKHDHDTRPAFDAPEVKRLDLAETVLALHAAGVPRAADFGWFEAPPSASLAAAEDLLARLGAVDGNGALTAVGRAMAAYPLHPRVARVMVEAERRGVGEEAAVLGAILGERDLLTSGEQRARAGAGAISGDSDVLDAMDLFAEAQRARFAEHRLRAMGIDPGAAHAVDRAARQLASIARRHGSSAGRATPTHKPVHGGPKTIAVDRELRFAILAGFPDRVARRRRPGSPELLLYGGGTADLAPASIVRDAQLLVAVDVDERQTGANRRVQVRVASAIDADWLIDVAADDVRDEQDVDWNAAGERVEVVTRLRYGPLVLDETRLPFAASHPANAPLVARAAALLADAALAAGIGKLADEEAIARWIERLRFAAAHAPPARRAASDTGESADGPLVPPGEDAVRAALIAACDGAASFAELREVSLLDRLRAKLSPRQTKLVADLAPDRVTLPGGRGVKIEYEPGKPPWIASRLQDFFGLTAGPAVAGGRVPLVLHLLAPNQRAVQVTTDLAGFWDRHYPTIRKELMRKYPRHLWPEDPRTAKPPPPRPPRR